MSRRSKMAPSHSTRIDAVEKLYRAVQDLPEITKFAFGVIKPVGSSGGRARVKIAEDSGALRLSVRGGTAVQVLRVYSRDLVKTKSDLIQAVQDLGWQLVDEEHHISESSPRPHKQKPPARAKPINYNMNRKTLRQGEPAASQAYSETLSSSPFAVLKDLFK